MTEVETWTNIPDDAAPYEDVYEAEFVGAILAEEA